MLGPAVDSAAELGALLAHYPVRDLSPHNAPQAEADQVLDPGEVVRQRAVTVALAAAVRVCAVEQERLHLSWDHAWGARLVDADGDVVPVESFVADAVAHRRVPGLLEWLGGLGAGLDSPGTSARVATPRTGPACRSRPSPGSTAGRASTWW